MDRSFRSTGITRFVVAPVAAFAFTASVAPCLQAQQARDLAASTVRSPGSAASSARMTIEAPEKRLFVGSSIRLKARVVDATGMTRSEVGAKWSSSSPMVASVDQFGVLTAGRPGAVTLRVSADGLTAERRFTVEANLIRTLTLTATHESARTGDVVQVQAVAYDAQGGRIANAPITYSLIASVDDTAASRAAAAEIDEKGRFVAHTAGDYTVLAVAPTVSTQRSIRVTARGVAQAVSLVGRAPIRDRETTDLHVWQAQDGRDYMVACASGAGARAYFFDVTDPTKPALADSVSVDSRSISDCAVDQDGKVAVIARQDATSRASGLLILDVSNPRDVKTLSAFADGLQGGSHNLFVYRKHVYLVNNSRRLDIISIDDPTRPKRASSFELEASTQPIHDVWVADGVAYVSQGRDGVALVDVGNGAKGGSAAKPVKIATARYPLGSMHAAQPYRTRTGKSYLIVGDERLHADSAAEPTGSAPRASGYAHIIDVTDPLRQEEVARYEVPEASPMNLWVEGERLYAAYSNGGLRVVDLSGELKGNLYSQGREIARFVPADRQGLVPNTAYTVGVQPYKGHIFLADRNSGVWIVRLDGR